MPTVLHITPWGIKCGIARHLSYWLTARSGSVSHAICASNPPEWYGTPEDWADVGLPVDRPWYRGDEGAFDTIRDNALDVGANIIHLQYDAHFWPWVTLAPFFGGCRDAGIKTVATAHVLWDVTDDATRANCALLEGVDRLVVGTPHMVRAFSDYAARFHITMRGPIEAIPLAAPPLPRGRAEKAAPSPCVFTFGLLGSHKGHLDILEGVRQLRSAGYPDARYVVAGAAVTGEQRQIRDALCEHAKRWPGLVEVREGFHAEKALYRWCQEADIVALGHRLPYASSSGTAIIAAVSGTPTAVADVPMLTSGLESVVVRVGSGPEDWRKAFARILQSPPENADAVADARKRFAPATVAAAHEGLYAAMLDGTPASDAAPPALSATAINEMLAQARIAHDEANQHYEQGRKAEAKARHLLDQADSAMREYRSSILGEGKA